MNRRRSARKSGSSFIELASALIVVIPLVLYGLDAATLYMGQSMNTDYCREACRAAGNGPPETYAVATGFTPKKRAQQVLRMRYNDKAMIQINPNDAEVTEQLFAPQPTAPFGGPVNGVVSVKTRVRILPPLPLPWMPHEVFLQTQQTFPFTWNMPGTFALNAGGNGLSSGVPGGSTNGNAAGNPPGGIPGGNLQLPGGTSQGSPTGTTSSPGQP